MSLQPCLRRAADAHGRGRALLRLIGEMVEGGIEQHGIGLGPVVEERGPETIDGGTADAEVCVTPLVLVPRVAVPLVGDADAAGEPGALVHDEHLAVSAVVHRRRA